MEGWRARYEFLWARNAHTRARAKKGGMARVYVSGRHPSLLCFSLPTVFIKELARAHRGGGEGGGKNRVRARTLANARVCSSPSRRQSREGMAYEPKTYEPNMPAGNAGAFSKFTRRASAASLSRAGGTFDNRERTRSRLEFPCVCVSLSRNVIPEKLHYRGILPRYRPAAEDSSKCVFLPLSLSPPSLCPSFCPFGRTVARKKAALHGT